MRYALWDDTPLDRHLSDIDRMLQSDKDTCYFALDARDDPIGFAEICIRDYANGCTQQPVPFLEGIWINADHRRDGIGEALIADIARRLTAQGYVELCSDILETNHQSHRAHEKWGFEETERVIYFRKGLA
jgi:aminoglycoside 6'-N-acetyltransferase I